MSRNAQQCSTKCLKGIQERLYYLRPKPAKLLQELLKTFEDSKRVQKNPKDSITFQKSPKDSKRLQKTPNKSKRFHKIPKDSKRVQKIPKESKWFQKIPEDSKGFQNAQEIAASSWGPKTLMITLLLPPANPLEESKNLRYPLFFGA